MQINKKKIAKAVLCVVLTEVFVIPLCREETDSVSEEIGRFK